MGAARVAGVHIKSGALNVSVVELDEDDTLRLVSATRLQPNGALSDTARFADLADRFRQHLSPSGVSAVAILHTRSYSNWKYAEAYARVFGICAVLQASSGLSVEAITYPTGQVGATVSLQANKLNEFAPEAVGATSAPTYWTTGVAEATAAAVHGLKALP
ncbi:hypothetical protein ABTZ46_17970 [Nocardioides sp. NPDC126508]